MKKKHRRRKLPTKIRKERSLMVMDMILTRKGGPHAPREEEEEDWEDDDWDWEEDERNE